MPAPPRPPSTRKAALLPKLMEVAEKDISTLLNLEERSREELEELASELAIAEVERLPNHDLTFRIRQAEAEADGQMYREGVLEILKQGWGFLRRGHLKPTKEDVYVSQSQIRRFGMKTGDWVSGPVRPPKRGEQYHGLLHVDTINFRAPELARDRTDFEKLTPTFPEERIRMESGQDDLTGRIIDLIAPIGKGQRGLIVSPPKAGKTTILRHIAHSISVNHPEMFLIVLLVDERPEEVTDMKRAVNAQVVSSTFDEPPENHMRVADLVLAEARGLVESGHDVTILLDSLTRLARASNLTCASSGRTLSGGLDPAAIHAPRKFFGSARNVEESGSLTIIASALVDTGSRMDDHIFEEFKGTGNMELHLDRGLQERRIFPALNIKKSGTRHDEYLYSEEKLEQIWKVHRALAALDTVSGTESLVDRLQATASNEEFLQIVDKALKAQAK